MNKINEISQSQLNTIRQQMLKFAFLQLNDESLAEDIVQDSLFIALKNQEKFKGQSALKTWIFAILKNKIIDYLRQKERFILESELIYDNETNHFFDENGHWKTEYNPKALRENEQAIYSQQFWVIFETCLTHLPTKQAKIFMMREYLELCSTEICTTENISESNLYVLLYRARLQLQHCLSKKIVLEK